MGRSCRVTESPRLGCSGSLLGRELPDDQGDRVLGPSARVDRRRYRCQSCPVRLQSLARTEARGHRAGVVLRARPLADRRITRHGRRTKIGSRWALYVSTSRSRLSSTASERMFPAPEFQSTRCPRGSFAAAPPRRRRIPGARASSAWLRMGRRTRGHIQWPRHGGCAVARARRLDRRWRARHAMWARTRRVTPATTARTTTRSRAVELRTAALFCGGICVQLRRDGVDEVTEPLDAAVECFHEATRSTDRDCS